MPHERIPGILENSRADLSARTQGLGAEMGVIQRSWVLAANGAGILLHTAEGSLKGLA